MSDARKYAPAAARNIDVIIEVLGPHLPKQGVVLEIASGSGEHITRLAEAYPALTFQPSDLDTESRASVDAWTSHLGLENVSPAISIDASKSFQPVTHAATVMCINMIHIAPWNAAVGLIGNAGRVLTPGGLFYLYGPFKKGGAHTAPSNAAFDESLRARDPSWGVRDLEDVTDLAASHGFGAPEIVAMPANNLSLLFTRR